MKALEKIEKCYWRYRKYVDLEAVIFVKPKIFVELRQEIAESMAAFPGITQIPFNIKLFGDQVDVFVREDIHPDVIVVNKKELERQRELETMKRMFGRLKDE